MNRDSKGRFARKSILFKSTAIGFFAFVLAVPFFHSDVMAMIDDMSNREYVAVTAEVKLDCTVATHMFTEECIMRLAEPMVESRAFFQKARSNRIEAQRVEDEAFEMMNGDIEAYNTIYGVTIEK